MKQTIENHVIRSFSCTFSEEFNIQNKNKMNPN